jgi:hypothetical protein
MFDWFKTLDELGPDKIAKMDRKEVIARANAELAGKITSQIIVDDLRQNWRRNLLSVALAAATATAGVYTLEKVFGPGNNAPAVTTESNTGKLQK